MAVMVAQSPNAMATGAKSTTTANTTTPMACPRLMASTSIVDGLQRVKDSRTPFERVRHLRPQGIGEGDQCCD